MPAPSPALKDSRNLVLAITVEGEAFDSDKIVSVEIWNAINRVPRARLVINDGDPSDREEFPLSEASTFLPGNKVTIAAGYDDDSDPIFSGVIVKHGIDIAPDAPSRLVVEMRDHALKMTLQRKNAVFKKKSDHDVVAQLIENNNLEVGTNKAPTTKQDAIVQFHASDWDMLLTRAEANGLLVVVDAGTVDVVEPDKAGNPVLEIEYGDSMLAFEAEVDAAAPLARDGAVSRSWSYTTQAIVEGVAADDAMTAPGNIEANTLAGVFGLTAAPRQSAAMLSRDELNSWSSAALKRARLARVCGQVRFQGSSLAKVGKMITLAGVGPRLSGDAYVTGTYHTISDNRWLTSVGFGLSASTFAADAPNIADPPAAGQLPPAQGLHTGLVKQVHEDPDGDHRVLVTLPLLAGESEGVWARLGGLYASSGFGSVFYPEVGDEVILGFMNEDPRSPIILGSVYSTKRAPAYPPNQQNDMKAIVTRAKMEVTFNEKDKIIVIKTPGGHSITLSDKDGEIAIKDSNSNSIVLGKSGIAIDSASKITMTAKTSIGIKAGTSLAMEAATDASLKALNITETANAKYAMSANAMAELKASGIMTIQGALVKIN
jgi:Rhs element Vgr protein